MRILLCLVPLAAIAAAPATDKADAVSKVIIGPDTIRCPIAPLTPAKDAKQPRAHPLTAEPGARQEIAVVQTDSNGCIKPVVVRDNVGGKSK